MSPAENTAAVDSWVDTGDRGSTFLALASDDDAALRGVVDALAHGWRKVWLDAAGGIAELMAPSFDHARTTSDVEDLVTALCHALRIDVVKLRDTTVESPGGGRGDPDSSFLIGARAAAYLRTAMQQGEDIADEEFLASESTSPDLAVEVEHAWKRVGKPRIYREAGVKELWDLGTRASGRAPSIRDLQAPNGPRREESSSLVPGVGADCLPAAAAYLRRIGGPIRFSVLMAKGERVDLALLQVAGARDNALDEPSEPELPF